jgi:hypothetical protein
MIDRRTDPAAWATFMYELEDAQEHLSNLCKELYNNCEYGEIELQIDIAHVYSHLNRAWNGRNATEKQSDDASLWRQWSRFPTDVEPL